MRRTRAHEEDLAHLAIGRICQQLGKLLNCGSGEEGVVSKGDTIKLFDDGLLDPRVVVADGNYGCASACVEDAISVAGVKIVALASCDCLRRRVYLGV
jgi:hypothetical protein